MKTLKGVMRRNFETVGAFVEEALVSTSANYAEIALAARAKMHSQTSRASVRFYASKLRGEGVKLPRRDRCYEDGSLVSPA